MAPSTRRSSPSSTRTQQPPKKVSWEEVADVSDSPRCPAVHEMVSMSKLRRSELKQKRMRQLRCLLLSLLLRTPSFLRHRETAAKPQPDMPRGWPGGGGGGRGRRKWTCVATVHACWQRGAGLRGENLLSQRRYGGCGRGRGSGARGGRRQSELE
eukprot:752813-Hanusia_phi.AAC.2